MAEVSGIESFPRHLALSGDGHRLAVLSERFGRQQVDIVDITTRRHRRIRNLQADPKAGRPLRTASPPWSTLAFTSDGQELVTAAVRQVLVRALPDGRPRVRLAAGEVAYPTADDRLVTLTTMDASTGTSSPRRIWCGISAVGDCCSLLLRISAPRNGTPLRLP
jgi:hypothetical protein